MKERKNIRDTFKINNKVDDMYKDQFIITNLEGGSSFSVDYQYYDGGLVNKTLNSNGITPEPTGAYIILKTSSESNAWSPSSITNTGATLHWEVTGAATYSVDTDTPIFDFSVPGEKIITITSADNLAGVEYVDLAEIDITSFDATGLTALQELYLSDNQLTSFDATGLTGLQRLYLSGNQLTSFDATGLTGLQRLDLGGNQLTSFDATGLTGLQRLYLNGNQLTSFDATGLTGLQLLNLYGNQLTTTSINAMLDQLITIGTAGNYLNATAQVGGGCGDPARIAALDAIWGNVSVDACP